MRGDWHFKYGFKFSTVYAWLQGNSNNGLLVMMNLVPIFRSLRLGAHHGYKCVYPEKFKFGHY